MEEQKDVILLAESEEGEDEEGEHPANKLIIQKARDRHRSASSTPDGASGRSTPEEVTAGGKRKRTAALRRTADRDQIAINFSHTDWGTGNGADDLDTTVLDSRSGADASSPGESEDKPDKRKRPKLGFKPPVGVTVIADDEDVVQLGMQRVMRPPRYFNKGSFDPSAKKCFNCGQRGHYFRDCPVAKRERPCFLCAKLGHDSSHCPASRVRCFMCNRLGHIARECPNPQDSLALPMLCTRCGKPDCAASGNPDWVRAEGHCSKDYSPEDLKHIRCYTCGKKGHLTCKPTTAPKPLTYCYNCGRKGHLGDACPEESTFAARREKGDAGNRRGFETLRSPPSHGSDPSKRSRHSREHSSGGGQAQGSYWQHDERELGHEQHQPYRQTYPANFNSPQSAYTYDQVPAQAYAPHGGARLSQHQAQPLPGQQYGGYQMFDASNGLQAQNQGRMQMPHTSQPYHVAGDTPFPRHTRR